MAATLSYAYDEIEMLLIVPKEGSYAFVEARLDQAMLDGIHTGATDRSFSLAVPTFTATSRTNLHEVIESRMGVETTSAPVEPALKIRADHPFLYVIRDTDTGAVLFVGRVLDPR